MCEIGDYFGPRQGKNGVDMTTNVAMLLRQLSLSCIEGDWEGRRNQQTSKRHFCTCYCCTNGQEDQGKLDQIRRS